MNRRRSRQVNIGGVTVGGDAPVRVQSMTITKTFDVPATLARIESLAAAGCELVRVAVPFDEDAAALADIARRSPIPVVGGKSVARYRGDELVDALVVAALDYHGRRSEGGEAS